MKGALHNIRVLDLSRILAGPVCTQILGDLGADIIKVECPGGGDDTRKWGPPFLGGRDGADTDESAYYLSANRNKRSVTIDITKPEGQALIHGLLEKCDVLIENFKTGGLEKYGLGHEQISERHPHIVYCAITGFGQTGPLANEPGYDFLAQAMSGFMAFTGAPGGDPVKAGVAISDIMTGLYAAIGILAALQARQHTGRGQMVDLALTDCMMAGMTNIAQYYLTSGTLAPRVGNAHATIVPYQAFRTADGWVVVAIGNDSQFRRFCNFIGHAEWADDVRFSTNRARLAHRDELSPLMQAIIESKPTDYWVSGLYEVDVPVGPVQDMAQAFAHPQTQARGMEIEMAHTLCDAPVKLVGSPLKLSDTPVAYNRAPPVCGEHTGEVLREMLGLDADKLTALKNGGVI